MHLPKLWMLPAALLAIAPTLQATPTVNTYLLSSKTVPLINYQVGNYVTGWTFDYATDVTCNSGSKVHIWIYHLGTTYRAIVNSPIPNASTDTAAIIQSTANAAIAKYDIYEFVKCYYPSYSYFPWYGY